MQWTRFIAVVEGLSLVGIVAVAAQGASGKNPLEGNADAIRTADGPLSRPMRRLPRDGCEGRSRRRTSPRCGRRAAPMRASSRRSRTVSPAQRCRPQPRLFDHETWQVLAYLRTLAASAPTGPPRGNAENGEKLFRTNCASCHRVNGVGGRLGPDLSRIGSARSREALVMRIRGAHRGIPDRLRAGDADAASGSADRGREEERGSLLRADHGRQRADPGLRQEHAEGRAERHRGRRCPFGFNRLSDAELDDVVRYLQTLRGFDPAVRPVAARPALVVARSTCARRLAFAGWPARRRRHGGGRRAAGRHRRALVTSQEIEEGLPATARAG